MGIKKAVIILDNQWNIYYSGQVVNGRIDYTFDSLKKVRGIFVQFKGEAQTSWSEKGSGRDADGKTTSIETQITGGEEYFQCSYYLLGSKTGNEIEIPAGQHTYNFTCTLPPVLPSSFEGEFGFVRYTVKVTLDRPWKFDQDTKMAFTVIHPLDLNLNPSYREPIRFQLEKTFCCCCCKSGLLSVDARAPASGYCPGQRIPVEVDVDNKSNVQVHNVKVALRKVVTYRAMQPKQSTKKSKSVVVEMLEGPVPAGIEKHWSMALEIPPLPPSNLVNCSIIDLDYDLKIECVVSGIHFNMKEKKYVTIGTIPLLGSTPPAQPSGDGTHNQNPGVPSQPENPGVPVQPPYGMVQPPNNNPTLPPYGSLQPSDNPTLPPYGTVQPPNVPSQPPYGSVQPSDNPTLPPYGSVQPPNVPSQPPYGSVQPSDNPSLPPYGSVQPTNVPSQPPYGSVQPTNVPGQSPYGVPNQPPYGVQPQNLPMGPGGDGAGGWVAPASQPPPHQSLYPSLSSPVYMESADSARTIQDRADSEFTKIVGRADFAPRYPTYASAPPTK